MLFSPDQTNITNLPTTFAHSDGLDPHIQRKKEIIAKHPDVLKLMGPNAWSGVIIVGLVLSQLVIASVVGHGQWWQIVMVAYLLGAFFNHSLFVMIHECTHNLVFKKSFTNKLMGIFCDFAQVLPSAMGFRKYHMFHHRYFGIHDMDPDICDHWEARLVGNSWWRKTIWMILFGVSQALRPAKIKNTPLFNKWIVANVVTILIVDGLIVAFMGPKALAYLGLSTLFALGLHPLGGRWIQEHYVTRTGQETYSYYGPLNKLAFNIGYHNEHHDIMNIPWNRISKLREMAPEFYHSLASYNSWTSLLVKFIFNKSMSPYSRIIR